MDDITPRNLIIQAVAKKMVLVAAQFELDCVVTAEPEFDINVSGLHVSWNNADCESEWHFRQLCRDAVRKGCHTISVYV